QLAPQTRDLGRLIRWRPDRRYWRLRRRAYGHVVTILQLALPTTQHCWHNPELSCHFGLHATAGLPQRYRLALELIRKPTFCRTRHHTPPGSAEPIIGVRQIEGRSDDRFWLPASRLERPALAHCCRRAP